MLACARRGATPKAIQELAGHTDLSVTLRYMHLAPAHLTDAVHLLDLRGSETPFGEPRKMPAENQRPRKMESLRNPEWAHQDSNLEPTGYEPAALTN